MDWKQLLIDNSIEYVESGPNTKQGEISVQCPLCGDDDPSQHLGISLSKEAWGCHRNAEHRGKSPVRLIQALLGCSSGQARLVLAQYSHNDPDGLSGALTLLNGTSDAPKPNEGTAMPVQWPREFQPITNRGRFADYLAYRGFHTPQEVGERYNLRCATTGRYKDRIIFPLYNTIGELIGWTGRAISDPKKAPRYLASSEAVKSTVYNYTHAQFGGKLLFIVEGPFDAMRIDNYAHWLMDAPISAVALMGTSMTVSQFGILRSLIKQHTTTVVLLDRDAYLQACKLQDAIADRTTRAHFYPYDVDGPSDPSEMTDGHLHFLFKRYGGIT